MIFDVFFQGVSTSSCLACVHRVISPFYSFVLSCRAYECKRGCGWPCFDTDLCFSHSNATSWHKNNLIYTTKAVRSLSKHCYYSNPRIAITNANWLCTAHQFPNGPFYSCLFSDVGFKWQRCCGWFCFDNDLIVFQVCCVNQVVLMPTSLHLNVKSREVWIKARSPLASLAFIGQVTEHTTVKCPIFNHLSRK